MQTTNQDFVRSLKGVKSRVDCFQDRGQRIVSVKKHLSEQLAPEKRPSASSHVDISTRPSFVHPAFKSSGIMNHESQKLSARAQLSFRGQPKAAHSALFRKNADLRLKHHRIANLEARTRVEHVRADPRFSGNPLDESAMSRKSNRSERSRRSGRSTRSYRSARSAGSFRRRFGQGRVNRSYERQPRMRSESSMFREGALDNRVRRGKSANMIPRWRRG